MLFTFSKPVKFEKEEYKDLTLNLEDMSGADFQAMQKEFIKQNPADNPIRQTATLLVWDDRFCVFIAAKKSDKPLEFFEALPVGDYLGVIGAVQSFFSASGLSRA